MFLLTSDDEIAKTFKKYFDEIVQSSKWVLYYKTSVIHEKKATSSIQQKSITNSKWKIKNISPFNYQPVSIDKVKNIIKTLNTKKACPDGDITVKLIKMNEDIFSRLMFQISINFLLMVNFLTV